jgi:hypothetical protein
MKFEILDRFSKNNLISNFMKIRPVGAELLHADGWTDGQMDRKRQAEREIDRFDETNSGFSKFCE